MREEIWTEKIFKDDTGYFLRITKSVLDAAKVRLTPRKGKKSRLFLLRDNVSRTFVCQKGNLCLHLQWLKSLRRRRSGGKVLTRCNPHANAHTQHQRKVV